jgi:arginyl-tRNA synthetase
MIESKLQQCVAEAVATLYHQNLIEESILIEKTRKDFQGDFTLVVFPFLKFSKKSPETTAREIGDYLVAHLPELESFEVVKGFLNLLLRNNYWLRLLWNFNQNTSPGLPGLDKKKVVLEYSSPNTNKPLHLGHIRNNLLGNAIGNILEAANSHVCRVNLVNDRGIHICKSMLAYIKWGNGETPVESGLKGDHFIGKYYVLFDRKYKEEIETLQISGIEKGVAEKTAPLIMEAQEMLRRWEEGDEATVTLWKKMNNWVYDGFSKTYQRLGIDFDKTYYESETYLLGKSIVKEGLDQGIFFRKEDGSVWVDLTGEGLDEKLLLRADGTSVYITQDLGTAQLRYDEFKPDGMVYVVGNEQNYHFEVLKKVLDKLGKPFAGSIYHLSYGMVELPDGKMKSREGTVVDADDLMEEMFRTAAQTTMELGKADELCDEDANKLFEIVGLGALKYFILRVDPKKNMLFDPTESIDFNGNTGPFIQYTHARIFSLLKKAEELGIDEGAGDHVFTQSLLPAEREIIKILAGYQEMVFKAAEEFNPSIIANYCYELARNYNSFYQEVPVIKEENKEKRSIRLRMAKKTAEIIAKSMQLLGIQVPDRM